MSAQIQVRAYVVGFGDCILLTLPDGKASRHVLIDFGRAPNDADSLQRFPAIARDIEARTNGHLDLIVVTHEHLDHLEGFYREREIFSRMDIDDVWMGLPSHPDYYKNYPKAKLQKRIRDAVGQFEGMARHKGLVLHPAFRSLLANNLANKDRVDYLRTLGKNSATYLARGRKATAATRWSKNVRVRVLAPEEDTSIYYGKSTRSKALLTRLAHEPGVSGVTTSEGFNWNFPDINRSRETSPPGLSASDYERLRREIREGGVEAARFIDHAQNNTSLALLFEVGGKRLLLPGDAELESWEHIAKHCKADLKPVDFLKVAHHGSHNGTPTDLLDTLLPTSRAKKAKVLVSTKRNVYGTKNPVPDASLIAELRRRCSQLVTTDGVTGTHVDVRV